jgi:predicted tellurium resistance membrane protein TerC
MIPHKPSPKEIRTKIKDNIFCCVFWIGLIVIGILLMNFVSMPQYAFVLILLLTCFASFSFGVTSEETDRLKKDFKKETGSEFDKYMEDEDWKNK